MQLRYTLQLRQRLECGLCLQDMDAEQEQSDSACALLCGIKPFAWCPNCGQNVPKETQQDPVFRERWVNRVAKIIASQIKTSEKHK